MLSLLPSILSIIAVIVSLIGGWRANEPKAGRFEPNPLKRNWLTCVTACLAILVLLANGSALIIRLFSPRHTLLCPSHLQSAHNLPNCGVWGITIDPEESVKSLHLVIHFNEPIAASVVSHVVDVDRRGPVGRGTEIDVPCRINAKAADLDGALTFQVSTDRREVIITGRDFSKYDAQTFIATFYPISASEEAQFSADAMGEVTFENLNHDIRGILKIVDPISGAVSEIGQTDSRSSKSLRQLMDEFWREDSFVLNAFGILFVIVTSAQSWKGRPQHRKPKNKNEHLLAVVSGFIAITMIVITGSTWVESRLMRQPVVFCGAFTYSNDRFPGCSFWGLAITPTSEMTSLNVVVTFAPTIHDFVATNGLEPGDNFEIKTAPRVADPCDFPDKPAGQNQLLTSSTSTDGHQIIIKGSNVTLYESQSFIAAFYPSSGREYPNKDIQISGEASYEAFGHDLPARILLVSFDESGKLTSRDLK